MTRDRLVIQLVSELAQVEAALADGDVALFEREGWQGTPDWHDGYWYGRLMTLRAMLVELGKLDKDFLS